MKSGVLHFVFESAIHGNMKSLKKGNSSKNDNYFRELYDAMVLNTNLLNIQSDVDLDIEDLLNRNDSYISFRINFILFAELFYQNLPNGPITLRNLPHHVRKIITRKSLPSRVTDAMINSYYLERRGFFAEKLSSMINKYQPTLLTQVMKVLTLYQSSNALVMFNKF